MTCNLCGNYGLVIVPHPEDWQPDAIGELVWTGRYRCAIICSCQCSDRWAGKTFERDYDRREYHGKGHLLNLPCYELRFPTWREQKSIGEKRRESEWGKVAQKVSA